MTKRSNPEMFVNGWKMITVIHESRIQRTCDPWHRPLSEYSIEQIELRTKVKKKLRSCTATIKWTLNLREQRIKFENSFLSARTWENRWATAVRSRATVNWTIPEEASSTSNWTCASVGTQPVGSRTFWKNNPTCHDNEIQVPLEYIDVKPEDQNPHWFENLFKFKMQNNSRVGILGGRHHMAFLDQSW